MIPLLALVALLQQGTYQGVTTPPSGDTTGYWQQHVHYRIVATLDESETKLRSQATLVYTNNSPDTLREMYFHQYLNAFRPGSKWSAADARENRERFQNLQEPDYGYERFTQAPIVDGVPVIVDYPGAPDSTVVHFRLPRPLAPHDSLMIQLMWDARPSTVPRRQGRRGRTWDFAQWYPKVAVYDRDGWEPNPLVPAGELYGEYGTYDVTMIVRDDQIVGATGVPVSGDPGWARVSRTGAPFIDSLAYGHIAPERVDVPAGYRAVRFYAEHVHHFAWSASPDYRYEGGSYVRQVPHQHFPTWDTVAVNVLYKPGDDTTFGGGRALDRTIAALKWLESIYGPYAYPTFTTLHRIEGGGTEFPMMIMVGGASQGLILHEGGHIYSYGILGNNEWRSGWMDEGLTSYQTAWAEHLTPQEQIGTVPIPPRLPEGYRVNAVTIPPAEQTLYLEQQRLELMDRTQPIGTVSKDFHEFGIYNEMIYNRAEVMYGQLRDVLGDSTFRAFLHDYYERWALKHVDEGAMRASAERVSGKPLAWFFGQWIHGTGLMDYGLTDVHVTTDGTRYETIAHVRRNGALRHPMPVGVQTASGWTIGRADPMLDEQDVRIVTADRPTLVQLDPYHVTWDWDRRNDVMSGFLLSVREPRVTFNWPWLDQADRSHTIVALSPAAWYSNPQGGVIGIRARTNYLDAVDLHEGGLAFSMRSPRDTLGHRASFLTRPQIWARAENLYLPGMRRPLMGYGAGFNFLDGLLKLDAYKKWDLSPFLFTPGPTIHAKAYATVAAPSDSLLLPEQWSNDDVAELGGTGSYKSVVTADGEYETAHASLAGGFATRNGGVGSPARGYVRADASLGAVRSIVGTTTQLRVRLYGGVAHNAPRQRAIFASTQDPFETFNNDLFRPRGALLKQSGINYLPLGGAGLRGFGINVPLDGVVAVNGEAVQRLASARGPWGRGTLSLSVFGDAASASSQSIVLPGSVLSDAGAGLIVQGRWYDRDVYLRLDAPILVNHASLAGGQGLGGHGTLAPRWTITVGDLWR
ncbi:MAG TPA: M1 family metallopeptidase [Gemmatimonadaceae bacterium]|nr:M1 family metallopeptidase [Gemmatimonadaceae bacterium]